MSRSLEELIFKAEELLFEKKFEKAIKIFKKILKTRPNDAGIRKSIGVAYFELEKYDNALENFKKGSELETMDSEFWSKMGKIYLIKKEKEKALWCYRKAYELDKKNLDDEFEELIGYGIKENIKSLENEGIIPVNPELDPKYIICKNCNNKILIDKNSKFCRICGNKI
ncbi:MAG: tetratricopeptide repeat protein [Candidatus Helarchaeota archaeon]